MLIHGKGTQRRAAPIPALNGLYRAGFAAGERGKARAIIDLTAELQTSAW
jgi:hypothetical protein